MKTFFIYYFCNETRKPTKESGEVATVKAKNEIEALKKYHIHLNLNRGVNNFFRNSTFQAEQI
jgi:hypothetical protein